MKARILAFGNVQGVGFRAYVKQIARNMRIRGFARNLDDGSIEIYALAPKSAIEKFLQNIKVKGSKTDPLSLNVERLVVWVEKQYGYIEPKAWPAAFEIDYGRELALENREMIERAEIASLILGRVDSKIGALNTKVDLSRLENNKNFHNLTSKTDRLITDSNKNFHNLTSKTDQLINDSNKNFNKLSAKTDNLNTDTNKNFNKLSAKTDNLNTDTNKNFGRLGHRYGSMSKTMKSIDKNLANLNRNIIKIARVAISK